MGKLAKYDEDVPDTGSAWAERIDRFPLDSLLRKHGFKIHSRPRNQPARWTKDNDILVFEDALLVLPPREVAAARGDDIVPTVIPLARTRY